VIFPTTYDKLKSYQFTSSAVRDPREYFAQQKPTGEVGFDLHH
jgi:hypothetical protein